MNALPELMINPVHNPELQDLKNQMDEVKEEIQDKFDVAKNGWAARIGVDIKLEADKTRGWIFRATKAADDKAIRSAVKNVEIVAILKNGVQFYTSGVRDAARRYRDLHEE